MTEFELKITAGPVNTGPVDRPNARPVLVTFRVRHQAGDAELPEQEVGSKHTTKFAEREY